MRSAGQSGAPSMKTIVAPSAPAPTTVHGPMIQPMSVANRTRSPALKSAWYAASRAIESRNPPCTWSAPFGFRSCPTCTRVGTGARLRPRRAPAHRGVRRSWAKRSRPAHRTWTPSGHSMTCSTDGASTSASSSVCLMATSRPRRLPKSDVTTTLAPESRSRCDTSRRGEAREDRHLDGSEVRAGVRGDRRLGRHRQEERDAVTGLDTEPASLRRDPSTHPDSSAEVARATPSSPDDRAARRALARPAVDTVSATFSRAPWNQVVHSTPRESSRSASSRVRAGSGVVADGPPEAIRLLDRDTVERGVVVAAQAASQADDVRLLELGGRWHPRELVLRLSVSVC